MTCELPEFYSCSEPAARKIYECCECDAPILIGEKHFAATGKWNGILKTFRQHFICEQTCELVRDEWNDGECIGFGDLFREWWGEVAWQYDRERDKDDPKWRKLRGMIAQIKWREWRAGT